jgi:Endoplasmic reticulum vesicle transporter
VPSYFTDASGRNFQVYQLTQNYISDFQAQQNLLMFNYELSPITVSYTQSKENFFEFLVQICAIIGGVFTVAGIVDALIHRSVSALFK